ncbi:hypothetical protein [Streptomyces sp. ISL-10]|uniref:hypothetical protein n=1 Tax=Streptomyces sp. ISL-10 TaxID=2819172 RepID=UPI0020355FDA|nr:hypothetical protein [Streptomyces sp. ISL-10]
MTPDASRRPRIQHVATTGTALAGVLVPLVAGMLLARSLGWDPMTPVNTLITRGGQQTGVGPAQWRGCRRYALRGARARPRLSALRTRRRAVGGDGAHHAAPSRAFSTL